MDLKKAQNILDTHASKVVAAIVVAVALSSARNVFLRARDRDVRVKDLKSKGRSRRHFVSSLQPSFSSLMKSTEDESAKYQVMAKKLFDCFSSAGGLQTNDSPEDNGRDQGDDFDFAPSVKAVGAAMKANVISSNDLKRSNMAKLFALHRMLTSEAEPPLQTCTAVRFTIQYNLFAGTIANLGSESQKEWLQREVLEKESLGSFILTETGAGVLSGLIVETLAIWQANGGFEIHSPNPEAVKNWVCNGLTAKYGVVIARLLLPPTEQNLKSKKRRFGETRIGSSLGSVDDYLDFGPHAFVVDLSLLDSKGSLTRTAMPKRTAFNSLDVASFNFQHANMPNDALLSGMSSVIDSTGDYALKDSSAPFKFEVVAQRLLAGRICISGAALGFLDTVLRKISKYDRKVPAGKSKKAPLITIPAISGLIDESKAVLLFLSAYVRLMEKRYCRETHISSQLVEDIALAKMITVEASIYYTHKLKSAIGSWSLLAESPFGAKVESLYAYKFAEGDTNILVQKVARDVTIRKAFAIRNLFGYYLNPFADSHTSAYRRALIRLGFQMSIGTIGKSPDKIMEHWLNQHHLVREVAWRHSVETIRRAVTSEYPEFRKSAELVFFDKFSVALLNLQI